MECGEAAIYIIVFLVLAVTISIAINLIQENLRTGLKKENKSLLDKLTNQQNQFKESKAVSAQVIADLKNKINENQYLIVQCADGTQDFRLVTKAVCPSENCDELLEPLKNACQEHYNKQHAGTSGLYD